ncbi:MAG: zinc-dependent metalloprotease, partial [Saprospiraceae bacterium]|nr:zinc-dependent metalloprotease [Saprospiraceae bacterium]
GFSDLEISCGNEGAAINLRDFAPSQESAKAGDCQLRTYRIALATTAEYTADFVNLPLDPTGVTGVMSNLNTLVTSINGIYQSDIGVRLQLIANNNLLIFTNAATDGFTDGNASTMAGENEVVVDAIIGDANYDVARAYGTRANGGANGLSQQIGNACNNNDKADGATVMNPSNAAGYFVLEMHELGHQFGANHTFNEGAAGSCGLAGQLTPSAAFEPGSGSTIMSYGGTCGSSDVQGSRDRYFHTFSLLQIANYITAGTGNTCPTTMATGNNPPSVSVSGGTSFVIPASTPFRLQASGSDPDGNSLTYTWEQMDNQLITHPPSPLAPNGPVFRSVFPTASPVRYFPNLSDLLDNISPTWEVLPSVARTLNFNVTVRDNVATGGCTDEASAVVTVDGNSGPFRVNGIGIEPSCLLAGESTLIQWAVANTDVAPVNCSGVDIWLSLDGGQTFSILLASNTPNDGSESVPIPPTAITQFGRIMVIGTGNIFFDINDNDVKIDCPENHIVTDNPASGDYRARINVETSGDVVVQAGSTARFLAGESVRLKPGFWAQAGCNFTARIQACDPCTSARPLVKKEVETPQPTVYFLDNSTDRSGITAVTPFNAIAFPNPFESYTTIQYEMLQDGNASIQLFDAMGRLVQDIQPQIHQTAGMHYVYPETGAWAAGVYTLRITCNGQQVMLKVIKG